MHKLRNTTDANLLQKQNVATSEPRDMQQFVVKMSQQQQDELHAQTSEHDGCKSVTETKRRNVRTT
jgi:hypothetical protein